MSAELMPQTNEFCTILDRTFLPHALVLLRSLQETCVDFRLRIFCMDANSLEVLSEIGGRGSVPFDFSSVEQSDPALAAVRHDRSRAEYCWTATPIVCRHVLHDEPGLSMITYLDADLMFFDDPALMLGQLDGGDSVMLFPQRIGWRNGAWAATSVPSTDVVRRLTETFGRFNAGSITFRNDCRGHAALDWWRERCLEWCYDRREPGRWADQRYLDDWPTRFEGVRVTDHPGAALAPWNTNACELAVRNGHVTADGSPAIFHHYQSLRLMRSRFGRWPSLLPNMSALSRHSPTVLARHDVWNPLSEAERRLLWIPYLTRLNAALTEVAEARPEFLESLPTLGLRDVVKDLARTTYLASYRAAGRLLPELLRTALSRFKFTVGRAPPELMRAKTRAAPRSSGPRQSRSSLLLAFRSAAKRRRGR